VEILEVEENTNINVLEAIEKNYLKPFKYVEAHVNVLDEIPQSYSHQGNLELYQTRYTTKTKDHEFVNSKVAKLFIKVCAFCEEEGHAIMDCPFMFFHIITNIARHVELYNVAITLMDQ
jgi:hypothetical protein